MTFWGIPKRSHYPDHFDHTQTPQVQKARDISFLAPKEGGFSVERGREKNFPPFRPGSIPNIENLDLSQFEQINGHFIILSHSPIATMLPIYSIIICFFESRFRAGKKDFLSP